LRSPDRLDLVHFLSFGDGRKAHHLPRLLPEHVADEVVLMQFAPGIGQHTRQQARLG
jgi:hypothetical protein